MRNKIVNIVNFIRALEPRRPMDLHTPVLRQLELAEKYRLPTTWLLQYDALLDDYYVDLLKHAPADHEVGIWFEVVQPQTEACGIPWRGRWAWDWHTDVGFSVGYTPEEREKLADEFVRLFREKFGFTPRSMGSWLFDAHLLRYLSDKYGIDAACNCKDQWGTDGYTLWGGYWANGYYPCRRNSYLPAQTAAEQIHVPVFRMLGSDPIYQSEAHLRKENGQPVFTLEPTCSDRDRNPRGGGVPAWIDWFFRTEFADPVMGMAYAQAGQENPFGWEWMKPGLEYQYPLIAKLRDEGKITVATLGDTGRWFKRKFPLTPATAVTALEDWQGNGREALWYMTRFGRVSLTRGEDGTLYIRDWQLNSEDLAEPFLTGVCRTSACAYEALPVCDGMRWEARLAFLADGAPLKGHFARPEDKGGDVLEVKTADGKLALALHDQTITFRYGFGVFALQLERKETCGAEWKSADGALEYTYKGMRYRLTADGAAIEVRNDRAFTVTANGPEIRLTARVCR